MQGYGRCRRNHAAARGGFIYDGCQEFMPGEGNHETCAVCGCHSCFHCEKYVAITIVNGVSPSLGNAAGQSWDQTHPPPPPPPSSTVAFAPLPITAVMPGSPPPPNQTPPQPMPSQVCPASHQSRANMAMPPPPIPSMAPREELQQVTVEASRCRVPVRLLETPERRRRRAKLSDGQKALMRSFAQGLGWRVQEQDEADLKRFCAAMGLRRNWFKLWMHKNRTASVASFTNVGPSGP